MDPKSLPSDAPKSIVCENGNDEWGGARSWKRSLARATHELNRLASQLGIPRSVKEEAMVIYRKALDQKLSRSIAIDVLVAAAVYAACRIRRIPRTLDEIAENSRVNRKMLGRSFRRLVRTVDVSIPISSPIDFIPRFAEELNLSGKVSRKAIELIQGAKEDDITAGKDPTGLAAASLYLAGILENEHRTQREIANVADVTEVTIRKRYKELVKKLELSPTA